MVAEDDTVVRDLVVRTLEAVGYTVLAADNGQTALELARKYASRPLHLLIADIVMPQIDGPDLAKQVKMLCPDIKILYISGYQHDLSLSDKRGTEACFLQKPFSPTTLAHTVREILDNVAG